MAKTRLVNAAAAMLGLGGVMAAALLAGPLHATARAASAGEQSPAGPHSPPTTSPGQAVRLLWSFEKDETARSLPEFGYWGEPTPIVYPGPGWRGQPIGPDYTGDITAVRKASSRDYPLMTLTARNATDGDYCYRYELHQKLNATIANWVKTTPGITACPPKDDYHDLVDWYWQRCPFSVYLWRSEPANRDWTGFDRLRFDVLSTQAPAVLGVKIRDMTATEGRPGPGPHGVRTPAVLFRVPPGRQVTCDVPLAQLARLCELDLSRIHRYHVRINGAEGATDIYLDNVRLVTQAAGQKDAALPLLKMEGEPKAWGRPVVHDGPTRRDEAKLERQLGPVEDLGPVVVTNSPGNYACGPGHFGGSGVTYFQSARRSCAAYDNNRLLVVIGGGPAEAKLMSRSIGEGGGVWAFASFDGGKTWGGPDPGQDQPARFGNWYWRGNLYSDRNGDAYWVGTQNCDSYHEGYDVLFRRLALVGPGWKADRVACVDQNGYKCPAWASAIRTDNGRLWAAWHDGFGGSYAKCSDDDGVTWQPCKDAAAQPPRPFYQPRLEDLARPPDQRPRPPQEVLLWPAQAVCGDFLLPYKGQVAVISADGGKWQAHDGKQWGPVQQGPFGKVRNAKGIISCSVLGQDHLFVSRFEIDKLSVARLADGNWQVEQLDDGEIVSDILAASGSSMFCFYIRNTGDKHEVLYRRWKDGQWQPAVKLAAEDAPLNQVGAPVFCPPDYAAVFWDQKKIDDKATTFVKFMRVANK